jgi:HEPN domain-containing protein
VSCQTKPFFIRNKLLRKQSKRFSYSTRFASRETHDLGELIVLIQQHAVMWPFAPDEVEALSLFAVETRYPDDTDPLSENEVSEAISLAEKVIEWAKKQIGQIP